MKIELEKICADGEGHVAYVKIVDDDGKTLDKKCLPFTTETKFNTAAKKYLADYKEKNSVKEEIKTKVLKKLDAINKGEL